MELDFVLKLMKLVDCNSIGWDQKKSYTGEDDDEDSDEGCFAAIGYRKMTKEEHEDYNNQINENMGFDVVVPTDVVGGVVYLSHSGGALRWMSLFRTISNIAQNWLLSPTTRIIKQHLRLASSSRQHMETCCSVNYITFEAMDGSGIHETFQAIVHEEAPLSGYKVCFCRIKPKS
ncbi:hypothetical protein RHGRI_030058 [Rhododendron griersonianum]|uniref:Uncharacterized protein n=1 Tax=Rhododendron griersonianum TaxID=479676 RepID=A0AAV6IR17_9ERIC|nr:hypothetical protein RHGRI_030058 [Rhododendron griersonianum]